MVIEVVIVLTAVSISVLMFGIFYHERAEKTTDAEEYVIAYEKRARYLNAAFLLGICVAVSSVLLPYRSWGQVAVMEMGFITILGAGIFYIDGEESIRKAGAVTLGTEGYKIPWVVIEYGPRIIEVRGHVDDDNVITVKTKKGTIRVHEKEAERALKRYLMTLQ